MKTIELSGRKYTVKFPNVGHFLDIESLKQALTRNRYGAMVASNMVGASKALDIVDAIAFFQTVCPDICRKINLDDPLTSLSAKDAAEFVRVYKKEFAPWIDQMMKDLSEIGDDEGDEADAGDAGQ